MPATIRRTEPIPPSSTKKPPLPAGPKNSDRTGPEQPQQRAAAMTAWSVAAGRASEVDEDISYGVRLAVCVISLAVGFALGYGTPV